MKFLIDTNVCIDVLRGCAEVVSRFRQHPPQDLAVSAVTVFELIQGAGRAPQGHRENERRKVGTFIGNLQTLGFDEDCARIAGGLNAELLNTGTPVGILDVFIAATALSAGLPVVTNNQREFSKIPGLQVIDWRSV